MFDKPILTRVLLPKLLWEEARDKDHLIQLITAYMKKYPNYSVKSVKDGFAFCERND